MSYFDATGLVMQHISTLEATQMMLESVVHGIPDQAWLLQHHLWL